jgi:hypothetical protein
VTRFVSGWWSSPFHATEQELGAIVTPSFAPLELGADLVVDWNPGTEFSPPDWTSPSGIDVP